MLGFLDLYRADDLILLLFCAQWILSGLHMCHKSRLTHYWSQTHEWSRYAQKHFGRDTDHCFMAFRGVLFLHHMKHLLGHMQHTAARQGRARELKHGMNIPASALCSHGLVKDQTKLESHWHKALKNPWSLSLTTRLTWLYSPAR